MGIFDRIGDRVGRIFDEVFVPEDVRGLLEEGRRLMQARNPRAAIMPLREAVTRRGDFPEARLMLGVALLQEGDARAAVNELTLARDLAPQNPEISVELGRALLALGELRPAKLAFRLGLEDERTRPSAHAGLADCHARAKEHRKATREYQKALASARRGQQDLSDEERAKISLRLGESYAALGDDAGIPYLRQASVSNALPPSLRGRAYQRLGESLRKADDAEGARTAFEEALALDPQSVPLLRAVAGARKAANEKDGARAALQQLFALAPEDPAGRNLSGILYREAGELPQALDEFERALARDPEAAPILRNAARAALSLGNGLAAERFALSLLALDPEDAIGLAARGLARVQRGDYAAARDDLERALRDESAPVDVEVILARVLSAAGERARGLALARRAVERDPSHEAARALLRELVAPPPPPKELAALAASLYQFTLSRPELGQLAPRAEEASHALERPMLLVVMGEFNAGKSTFVNALLGEEATAMGVTPTTATINVLRYGATRVARVWGRDGASRDLSPEDARHVLTRLEADEARAIDRVEIFVPNPALERVHLVDTPGLNSLLPEHEEVTRRFVERADAVVWLFDIGQAGKSTERRVLDLIQGHKAKTLGVVNKIDRVSEAERTQVFGFLTSELGAYFESILGVSARRGLKAILEKDEPGQRESGFSALRAHLESEYFAKSRAIVADGVRERLRLLVLEATEILALRAGRLALAQEAVSAAAELARQRQRSFRVFAAQEASALGAAVLGLASGAAEEVLDFVRPRRSVWGSNEADPEDRAYLVELVENRLSELVNDAKARARERARSLVEELTQAASQGLAEGTGDPVLEAARARLLALREAAQARESEMTARVYDRFLAFAQGYLRGGRLDEFFQKTLRRLDLDRATVEAALKDAFPVETDTWIERPLSAWGDESCSAWHDGARRVAGVLAAERLASEASAQQPTRALLDALSPSA